MDGFVVAFLLIFLTPFTYWTVMAWLKWKERDDFKR